MDPNNISKSPSSSSAKPSVLKPRLTGEKKNIWPAISILLAIALVVSLSGGFSGKLGKSSGSKAIPAEEASDILLNFVNEVYAAQVGISVLKDVTEVNGLYQVTVTVNNPATNQSIDQVIFVTLNGKMFIPQALNIDDAAGQFRTFLEQQQLLQDQSGDVPEGAQ